MRLKIEFHKLSKSKIISFQILVIVLALVLRVFGLDLNPVGMSHDDELNEIINAKSLALTGSFTPRHIAGILTQNDTCALGDCIYGELGPILQVPLMWFFPMSMVWSKLLFVAISVGLVFFCGKLFENLSKNKTIGVIVSFCVAINPWAIYYGRTAYTHNFSYFFFILAAYIFTRHKSYKSNLILGSLCSFMASLFYFGAKSIFPLIIAWGIIYNLSQFKSHYLKFTGWLILISALIGFGYFWVLAHSYAGERFIEIGTNNRGYLVEISARIESFLKFFSFSSLFLTGQEPADNYYMSNIGYYYLLDLPFLVFGIMAISKRLKEACFILLLISIFVLPAALKTSQASIYSLRTATAYFVISGIIGWGIYFCYKKIAQLQTRFTKPLSKAFSITLVLLYSLSLLYFLFLYWYHNPIQQSKRWFFHERLVANYITRSQKVDQAVVVLTARPNSMFNSYVFFSGVYNNADNIKKINKQYLNEDYRYENVRFIDNCSQLKLEDLKNNTVFFDQINPVNCNINQQGTPKVANPVDAGGIFNIVNDKLCESYTRQRFPKPRNVFDFKVEDLSQIDFCKIWITDPSSAVY